MAATSHDDELLAILLTNLRNAAATFGEGTPPYESIRTTIEDHLRAMQARGEKTNLTMARQERILPASKNTPPEIPEQAKTVPPTFTNLAFRPKP